MTIKELIDKLKEFDENKTIYLHDYEYNSSCEITQVVLDMKDNVVVWCE